MAPLCGTLGYSAEDAAVSLGLMANAGIKGSQAGTTLKTAIANLAAPTEKQSAEMERLGISLTGAGGEMLTMQELVGNLRGAFSGMSEAEQSAAASTLFGKEAMSGMLAIINASEADYQSLTQSIYNSAGAAERMANIKLDNLAGDLTLLQSATDGLSLSIGQQFMPQIRGLVQAGTGIITFTNELIDQHPILTKVVLGAAGAVGVLTAGVVAYNAAQSVMAALNVASLFAGPVGPILAVGAAVGALTAGIIGLVEAANEGVPKVDELTQAAQNAAGAMEEVSVDFDASDEISQGQKMVDAYQEALDLSNAAAEEARAATEGYAQAMAGLTGDSQGAARAVDDVTASVLAMSDSLVNEATVGILEAGAAMGISVGVLSQEYGEAYTAAYDSISGQMGLFEQMSVEVETSVSGMIASLESQAAYMAGYSENLRAAAEMGLSEGLIAQLSDGSTESAAYLQEIVNNGQGKIDELNAAFAKVQEGKEDFSATVAEMQTNLQSTMDEAARTVDSTVQEMDMYREAAQSARSTMQGFIDGANGMAESVQTAYRNVARGAMAAIQGAMGVGLSVTRGYATGTTDAAPGFAMVGENGPELVFFQGGEQVVNATQTAAMQRQSALSAAPAGPSGGEPMVIQIYFQFEGSATPEAVAQLREYSAEFEARVRQVMEEYTLDSARRRY